MPISKKIYSDEARKLAEEGTSLKAGQLTVTQIPPVAISWSSTTIFPTGSWSQVRPRFQRQLAPCRDGCPVNEDIEDFLHHVQHDDLEGAWRIIMRENPCTLIKFTSSTRMQLNAMYNSPVISSQGEREGFFVTNLSIRQDFFDRLLSATLQIRDVFSTSKYNSISEGTNFYFERFRKREAPMVMLNISFKFNDYEKDKKQRQRGENGMEEEEDF